MPAPDMAKHEYIGDELLREIRSGKYKDRLPSEAQLVKRFGVSRPTVARALRDLQDAGLVERRVGSGTYLSRSQNELPGARASRLIGLLIPGARTMELFERLSGELMSLAATMKCETTWGTAGAIEFEGGLSAKQALNLADQFIEQRVKGVLFAPLEHVENPDEVNRQIVEKLMREGIAVVMLDRDFAPFPQRSEFDLVGLDNFQGGYALGEHLLRLGCERIFFFSRPLAAGTSRARAAGARAALRANGHLATTEFEQEGDPEDRELARQLIVRHQAEGIICVNDQTAALLMRTLERNGVKVPRDVRVVGFDDLKYASLLSAPLTTMHQPCRDLAVIAWRAMDERLREPTLPPRTILLSASLKVRESCGAYAQKGGS